MNKVRRGVTLALLAVALTATPAYAIDEPDSVSLDDIRVFEDLISTGDFLAVVPYTITFGTAPDEPINETFIFRLLSPDGSTENGTALAYPAYNSGYGSGVVSFYFESGMTWEASYIFRVQENPAVYPSPQHRDFVISSTNYETAADQALALKAKVLDLAADLRTGFGVTLTETSESGATVLNTYGENYFLEAIPGLPGMVPALFSVQLEDPDFTKRTWSTAFADQMMTTYNGTFIWDAMTGFAGLWSTTRSAAMTTLSILMAVVLIGLSVAKFKASMLAAVSDGYVLLLLLMLEGAFPMVAAGGIAFASVFLGGVILLLNRS